MGFVLLGLVYLLSYTLGSKAGCLCWRNLKSESMELLWSASNSAILDDFENFVGFLLDKENGFSP